MSGRSRCCSGNGGLLCCCCCGKRGATIFFSLAGLLLAAAVIVPPVYVHQTDKDYAKLFPILTYGRMYLEQATERYGPPTSFNDSPETAYPIETDVLSSTTSKSLSVTTPTARTTIATTSDPTSSETATGAGEIVSSTNKPEAAGVSSKVVMRMLGHQDDEARANGKSRTYRLAIFQLIDDIEAMSEVMAFTWFCIGCLNVPLDLLLLVGAVLRQPCGLLPWLIVTLLEHIVLGVPFIVFFGLISLYLAAQLHLYVVAIGLIVGVVVMFILSISSWFTVQSCYRQFCKEDTYRYDTLCHQNGIGSSYGGGGGGVDGHRRSGHHTGEHSLLPPGHPSRCSTNGYRINGYYPPHQSSRQLPPVPP